MDLNEVARKVNEIVEKVHSVGLTNEEVLELENYISQQETLGPLLNPTLYAHGGGFKLLDRAKERLSVIKPIVGLINAEDA